jgi:hypothetical protein
MSVAIKDLWRRADATAGVNAGRFELMRAGS